MIEMTSKIYCFNCKNYMDYYEQFGYTRVICNKCDLDWRINDIDKLCPVCGCNSGIYTAITETESWIQKCAVFLCSNPRCPEYELTRLCSYNDYINNQNVNKYPVIKYRNTEFFKDKDWTMIVDNKEFSIDSDLFKSFLESIIYVRT